MFNYKDQTAKHAGMQNLINRNLRRDGEDKMIHAKKLLKKFYVPKTIFRTVNRIAEYRAKRDAIEGIN